MNLTTSLNHISEIHDVIELYREQIPALEGEEPVELFVDGQCQNPGPMGVSMWLKQGKNCLFTHRFKAGHGTCNEAEYIAVKAGLTVVQAFYGHLASPKLTEKDLKNPQGLAATLLKQDTSLSAHLISQFTEVELVKLKQKSSDVSEILLNKLNSVIEGGSMLYSETLFAAIPIAATTKKALAALTPMTAQMAKQKVADIGRSNRMLIEDAYRSYIVKRPQLLIKSDSQLVVQHVRGLWKCNGINKQYCQEIRRFQRIFPFELIKIDRRDNEIADSMAQDYVLRQTGRCMTIEDGRFNVKKQGPATLRTLKAFTALTNESLKTFLANNNVNAEMRLLLRYIEEHRYEDVLSIVGLIESKINLIFDNLPPVSHIVQNWLIHTFTLIQDTIRSMRQAIEQKDDETLRYFIEELIHLDSPEACFDSQVEQLNSHSEGHWTSLNSIDQEEEQLHY